MRLAPVPFTVTVVDSAPSVSLSASGSVDPLRRAVSSVVYSLTSLNNLNGIATGVLFITGEDASLFEIADVNYDEFFRPQVAIRLKNSAECSTASTYRIRLLFDFLLENGDVVQVESGTLKIKPVQSKPGLAADPASQTYCQSQSRDRTVKYSLSLTGAEGAAMESVEVGKVKFWQSSLADQAKTIVIDVKDDTADIYVTMKDTSLFAAGKKYTLPLQVSLKGAASNANAPLKVSLSLNIVI